MTIAAGSSLGIVERVQPCSRAELLAVHQAATMLVQMVRLGRPRWLNCESSPKMQAGSEGSLAPVH